MFLEMELMFLKKKIKQNCVFEKTCYLKQKFFLKKNNNFFSEKILFFGKNTLKKLKKKFIGSKTFFGRTILQNNFLKKLFFSPLGPRSPVI